MDSKLGFIERKLSSKLSLKYNFENSFKEPERDLEGNYFGTSVSQRFGMKNKELREFMTHKGVIGSTEGEKIGRRGGWEK